MLQGVGDEHSEKRVPKNVGRVDPQPRRVASTRRRALGLLYAASHRRRGARPPRALDLVSSASSSAPSSSADARARRLRRRPPPPPPSPAKMFAALGLSDNQKVGLMMTGLGLAFLLLGMLLLFDSGLLAIGNVLFLVGLALLVGVAKFLEFFNPMRKKGKPRGVACFVLGVLLVLWRWPVVGMLLEIFGLFEMFASRRSAKRERGGGAARNAGARRHAACARNARVKHAASTRRARGGHTARSMRHAHALRAACLSALFRLDCLALALTVPCAKSRCATRHAPRAPRRAGHFPAARLRGAGHAPRRWPLPAAKARGAPR